MPTYEYYCENCSSTFSAKMSISDHDAGKITCPECQKSQTVQQFTAFFAKTAKKS